MTPVSTLLCGAFALAASALPISEERNSTSLEVRQNYSFNCDAAPPAQFPGQGGIISYSTASSTIHQAPLGRGRSGYPHEFTNKQNLPLGRNCDAAAKNGGLFEFPVFSDGHLYDWTSARPKDNPGPARVLFTTPSKDFCGVIAHDGPGNTEPFHICGVVT
ncbi:hypothetical protein KC330_g8759 [Hortaea werneckii]|nr:hypothetical protein KC330_g8759 [Hortaea werneckii]